MIHSWLSFFINIAKGEDYLYLYVLYKLFKMMMSFVSKIKFIQLLQVMKIYKDIIAFGGKYFETYFMTQNLCLCIFPSNHITHILMHTTGHRPSGCCSHKTNSLFYMYNWQAWRINVEHSGGVMAIVVLCMLQPFILRWKDLPDRFWNIPSEIKHHQRSVFLNYW
jgi:hypothetical protein